MDAKRGEADQAGFPERVLSHADGDARVGNAAGQTATDSAPDTEGGAVGAGADARDKGPGLCVAELGRLPAGTILDERRLAEMFDCHPASIKRAVKRGELPAPVRMFGRPCWTAGAIVRYVEARLTEAQREAEREAARLARLSP